MNFMVKNYFDIFFYNSWYCSSYSRMNFPISIFFEIPQYIHMYIAIESLKNWLRIKKEKKNDLKI